MIKSSGKDQLKNYDHAEEINYKIKEFILKHFPRVRKQDFSYDAPLLESRIIDSLGVLELVPFLEEEFKIGITDEELNRDNFFSIRHIGTFIEKKRNNTTKIS